VTGVVGLSGSEVGEREKKKEENGLGGKEGKEKSVARDCCLMPVSPVSRGWGARGPRPVCVGDTGAAVEAFSSLGRKPRGRVLIKWSRGPWRCRGVSSGGVSWAGPTRLVEACRLGSRPARALESQPQRTVSGKLPVHLQLAKRKVREAFGLGGINRRSTERRPAGRPRRTWQRAPRQIGKKQIGKSGDRETGRGAAGRGSRVPEVDAVRRLTRQYPAKQAGRRRLSKVCLPRSWRSRRYHSDLRS